MTTPKTIVEYSSSFGLLINFIFVKKKMNKILLLIAVIMYLATKTYSSHIVVSGIVSGTWEVDTVIVSNNIQVSSGQMLAIYPGTLVLFTGHYSFKIDGTVKASGSSADSILFTIADTTDFQNLESGDGSWDGLWFYHLGPINDSSIFEFCRFEYSKASYDPDSVNWYGGAVTVREFDRLRFSRCRFINNRAYKNGGAIYARQANIQIDDCSFENNFCGQPAVLFGYGGGICLEYSDAMIYRNYFTLNSSTGVGGGLSFEFSDPSVVANHFFDNYSALGGGFTCLRSQGMKPLVNNLVESNNSLYFGGGIAVLETTAPFINNTIVSNYSSAGGGIYFNANSFAVFKNCLVWGNIDLGGGGSQVYIWDTFSAPEFMYCDVEGGDEAFGGTGGGSGGFIGVYENCFEADPNFNGLQPDPYQPLENSICVNNGTPDTTGLYLPNTDFAGNDRVLNNQVDIGAYETSVSTFDNEIIDNALSVTVYPNPTTEIVTVNASHTITTAVLYNASGTIVRQADGNSKQSVTLDISGLPAGMYFIRLFSCENFSAAYLISVK
jgi:predicted outer membrane repeat protein